MGRILRHQTRVLSDALMLDNWVTYPRRSRDEAFSATARGTWLAPGISTAKDYGSAIGSVKLQGFYSTKNGSFTGAVYIPLGTR